MKKIAELVAKIAFSAAKSAAGAASDWNMYQPKEPTCIKKIVK